MDLSSRHIDQQTAVVCLYLQRSSRKVKFAAVGGSEPSSSCSNSITTETTKTDDDDDVLPQSPDSSFSDD